MDITDIPAVKAERDERPDSCLHCVVQTTVEEWFQRHGERRNGAVILDVTEIISKLTECIAEAILACPDRNQRRRAIRFAHEALDGNMKAQQAGKLIAVDIPHEH